VGMAGMAMVLPFCIPGLQGLNIRESGSLGPDSIFIAFAGTLFQSFSEKGRDAVKKIASVLRLWIKNPRSLLISLAWSWVHMLCLFGILWILLNSLGESISFWLIAGLYALVYFFTLIPISINGYGLQEVSMTFVFYQLGGVSLAGSLTTAILFRTLIIIGSLPGAFFVPGLVSPAKVPDKGS